MTANQLLQRIREVSCRSPDVIPRGWQSAEDFALKWKVAASSARRSLQNGVLGGAVEKKSFFVRTSRATVLVSYFRALEKKRGK